jgi:hypothetical protein
VGEYRLKLASTTEDCEAESGIINFITSDYALNRVVMTDRRKIGSNGILYSGEEMHVDFRVDIQWNKIRLPARDVRCVLTLKVTGESGARQLVDPVPFSPADADSRGRIRLPVSVWIPDGIRGDSYPMEFRISLSRDSALSVCDSNSGNNSQDFSLSLQR